jgi:hypothetical protein
MNKWNMWKQSRNRLKMNSKYQWFFLVPTYHILGFRRTNSNEKYESTMLQRDFYTIHNLPDCDISWG